MRLPFTGLYPLTQAFGVNPQYYTQFLVLYPDGTRKPMAGHNGLDFGCPHNTEVVAPHKGKVIEATFDQHGYGNYVKIENDEMGSVLAHLDRIDVQVGFELQEGDRIGWSDNTGYSTGAHLHWGWYSKPRDRNNGYGGFYDQTRLLEQSHIFLTVGQVPRVDQPQNAGQLYTKEQYDAAMADRQKFWEERDDALAKLDAATKRITELESKSSSFSALGYNSIDDLTRAFKDKDDTIVALQTENASIRRRNGNLALEINKMEEEDATSAELGLKAAEELKNLKDGMNQIAQVAEAPKPTTTHIVNQIFNLKELFERTTQALERERQKTSPSPSVAEINPPPAKTSTSTNWIDSLFA